MTSYSFKPATLLLVVVAVAFTRITEFEPGIIFGLVAGVGFGALVGQAQEARAALVMLGYGAAAGLMAWFAYGALGDPDGVVGTFVSETLAATAIAGMAALPIALFPLPGMPGHAVFAWNRTRWAGCYALGLVAFFLVLMPTPYAWEEVGWTLRAWVLGYLAYLGAALVLWSLVRRSRTGPDASTPMTGSRRATGIVRPARRSNLTTSGASRSTTSFQMASRSSPSSSRGTAWNCLALICTSATSTARRLRNQSGSLTGTRAGAPHDIAPSAVSR